MLTSAAPVLALSTTAACTAGAGSPGGDDPVAQLVTTLQSGAGLSDQDVPARAAATDAAMLEGLAASAAGDRGDPLGIADSIAAVTVDAAAFAPSEVASDADVPTAVAPASVAAASSVLRSAAVPASVVRTASPARTAPPAGADTALFAVRMAGTALMGEVLASAVPSVQEIPDGMTKHVADGPITVDLGFSDGRFGGSISMTSPSTDPAMPGSLTSKLEFDLQGCPAADGSFTAEVRGDGRLDLASGSSTTWASEQWAMAVTGQVDDTATVTNATLTHRLASTNGSSGSDGRGGADFASEWVLTSASTSDGWTTSPDGLPRIDRSSGAITAAETVRRLRYQFDTAQLQSWLVLELIQRIVSSGTCVQLAIEGPSALPGVDPGSTTTVTARPTRRVDGVAAGGTVLASVRSGKGAIEPTAQTPAPAPFFFAAPFENDYTTVAFTSTSRSGVGRAAQDFAVGGGWVARRFVEGILLEGRKCGPVTGDWTFTAIADWGYHADITATVGADLAGSYTISGSTEVSTFSGGGSVRLEASGQDYLMYFDTGDAPVQVTRDPGMRDCRYEVD